MLQTCELPGTAWENERWLLSLGRNRLWVKAPKDFLSSLNSREPLPLGQQITTFAKRVTNFSASFPSILRLKHSSDRSTKDAHFLRYSSPAACAQSSIFSELNFVSRRLWLARRLIESRAIFATKNSEERKSYWTVDVFIFNSTLLLNLEFLWLYL